MQTVKIIGAGICALFAVGSLFSALGKLNGGATTGAGFTDSLPFSIIAFLVFAALAVFLWRGATARRGMPR